ncbi:MAG: ABC transporter permease [Acidobacteriaceae bacterium]|jgi:putative ABC transport system permease protein|nr:ABC transporter permease [Acidobacteriaceae bacterium]
MAPAGQNPRSFENTLASARSTMLFSEIVQLAIDSFKASKVRFLLTMLGMVIGSASIILVVTIGLTGKQYALNMIQSIGPNMVEVMYQGGTVAGPNNTSTPDYLTNEDMTAVNAQVPGIVASSPMLEIRDHVNMGNGIQKEALVLGVSPQYKDVRNLVLLGGRFFDDQDTVTHAKVAVVNEPFAKALYGNDDSAVGNTFSLSGIPFVIIGVFKESVDTFGQSEIEEQTILIPYPVARYFTGTDTVKQIFFSMADASMVIPASAEIDRVIQSRHRPTSVYKAFNLTQVLTVMGKIANMLTIMLTLAAAITLIVSGVGIMNSMLATVQARLREIGIRKALGATSKEIRLQFLVEAVFISLSGGIVGTLLGLAVPFTVDILTPFKIPISIWSIVIALATSVLVGVGFGTLPANRAAHLNPVETLKYE